MSDFPKSALRVGLRVTSAIDTPGRVVRIDHAGREDWEIEIAWDNGNVSVINHFDGDHITVPWTAQDWRATMPWTKQEWRADISHCGAGLSILGKYMRSGADCCLNAADYLHVYVPVVIGHDDCELLLGLGWFRADDDVWVFPPERRGRQ